MATIRKREWTNRRGEKKAAWVLSYVDKDGKQHRPQFPMKREADEERVRIEGELAKGVHVPDRHSSTVHDAAKAFLADFETMVKAAKRERSTLRAYRQHVDLHIAQFPIARVKLSRLSGPDCEKFARDLEGARSDAMATRIFSTFRMIVDFAWAKGLCSGNPSRAVKIRTAGDRAASSVEFPAKEHLRSLLEAADRFDNKGRAKAFVSLLLFTGLRMSELRGLGRHDYDRKRRCIRVTRRADRWNVLGTVKTKNARRSIPLSQGTEAALRKWMMAAPLSKDNLVFPNGSGSVESYANLYNRLWVPLMKSAGLVDVVTPATDDSAEKVRPWFAFHALRHAACSLWIEQNGTPKKVMTWAGHASIQFTMDTYGHLWDDPESDQAMALAAERSILG